MSSRHIRIIPRLDIKGPNLVKGVHLEGLRVLGKPEDFAYQYYLDGADELIFIDIVASLYRRNNLLEIVKRTAEKIFIPLAVGGGIRTVEDIRNVLRAGADKVVINTAAIHNPGLIKESSMVFGSQCIVVSIEAKKNNNGSYEAFTDNGRQETGIDVLKWARKVCELGAGEILVTSIDRDGTGEGYDIELISSILDVVSIPVIACGGAGTSEDVKEIITLTDVDAVSVASIFHYNKISRDFSIDKFEEEGNIEFLKKYSKTCNYNLKWIEPLSISELKLQIEKIKHVHIRTVNADTYDNAEARFLKNGHSTHSLNDKGLVVVIDFGCGNLFSVTHALKKIGANFRVSDDPKIISQADKLILPGVGSFKSGMVNLKTGGLIEPIGEHINGGKPLLGICLGMQLLMSEGEEFGVNKGLGLIRGAVRKLQVSGKDDSSLRVPHIGWSQIKLPNNSNYNNNKNGFWQNTILDDLPCGSLMYFIHSYIVIPDNKKHILAESEYGNSTFCSVIQNNNIYGCQFHPERSGEIGLNIYNQFVFGSLKQAIKS